MPRIATNPQNLIPQNKRTPEERREVARKGGMASGEARRKMKTFKEVLEQLLAKEIVDKETGETIETIVAITAKQVAKANKGDTKAFEVIRDTLGQKPVERVEISDIDSKIAQEIEDYVG